jgi:hypothetical protein
MKGEPAEGFDPSGLIKVDLKESPGLKLSLPGPDSNTKGHSD